MRRGIILGLLGWFLATALFRGFPNVFLPIDRDAFLVVFLLGGLLIALFMVLAIKVVCEPGKAVRFGAGVCVPGLLLDSAAVLSFEKIFPWVDSSMAGPFGAMMLWAYGLILAIALLFGDRIKPARETVG